MSTALPLISGLVQSAFWYCCDFMLNLANRTGTSYDEANTWVLLLLIPGLLLGLLGVRVAQGFRLRSRKIIKNEE